MSNPIQIEGQCPQCETNLSVERLEIVDAAVDTEVKAALLAGTYFDEVCPQCKAEFLAATPLVYYDSARRALIQFVPGGETSGALPVEEIFHALNATANEKQSRFIKRLVVNPNQLLEKIHLLDEGLDDRIVEVVKAIAVQSNMEALPDLSTLKQVLYVPAEDSDSPPSLAFLFADEEEAPSCDFSRDLYELLGMQHIQALDDLPDQGFEIVDLSWALRFLTDLQNKQAENK